jgi:hypothetical protein
VNVTDLISGLTPHQFLAIVIAFSIVLYAVAANLGWLLQRQDPSGAFTQRVEWMQSSRLMLVLKEITRWLYYLGLPYAALMVGYDTVRALGVWNLDWLRGIVPALVLAVGSVVLVLWIWRPYTQKQHPHAVDESRWNWARHIVELLYQQAHWSFYRSGPILWVGDVYWGSFLGLGLAYIEGWTNPNVRAGVREVTRADAPLWTGSLAVITTVIFIYTQNLWYCLAVHLLLDSGLRGLIGFPRVSTIDETGMSSFEFAYDARSIGSESDEAADETSTGLFATDQSFFAGRETTFESETDEYGSSGTAVEADVEDENDGAGDERGT